MIEGLCFGFRELAEKMRLPLEKYGTVKVVGGGAKSPVWLQTMANVLNIAVEKMEGMIDFYEEDKMFCVHIYLPE